MIHFITGCAGNYNDEGPISQYAYEYDELMEKCFNYRQYIWCIYECGGAYECTMGMYRPGFIQHVKDIRN